MVKSTNSTKSERRGRTPCRSNSRSTTRGLDGKALHLVTIALAVATRIVLRRVLHPGLVLEIVVAATAADPEALTSLVQALTSLALAANDLHEARENLAQRAGARVRAKEKEKYAASVRTHLVLLADSKTVNDGVDHGIRSGTMLHTLPSISVVS